MLCLHHLPLVEHHNTLIFNLTSYTLLCMYIITANINDNVFIYLTYIRIILISFSHILRLFTIYRNLIDQWDCTIKDVAMRNSYSLNWFRTGQGWDDPGFYRWTLGRFCVRFCECGGFLLSGRVVIDRNSGLDGNLEIYRWVETGNRKATRSFRWRLLKLYNC